MQITDLAPQPTTADRVLLSEPPASDLPFYRKLGRTDLTVSCLGVGGGGGLSSEDTLHAFQQGINYFFFSSDLHHCFYSTMADALRQLCGRSSSLREKVVLATVTYIKHPEAALSALFDQFHELGLDYVDIFFWGWIDQQDAAAFECCLQLSNDLRGPHALYQRMIERLFGASERLKRMGAVRYVGASFHDLDLAQQWMHSSLLDVVMVRHNPAHRSAQQKVFNPLSPVAAQRPGIVTFKSTGSHTVPLWETPPGLPKECWKPTVPDFYRYSLSQSSVDVCLIGPRNQFEIDAAIAGVQRGKLTTAELEYLNIYGDLHRDRRTIQTIAPDKFIYRT